MRSIKVFTLVAFSILITSCSDQLVGTWTVEKYETKTMGNQGVTLSNIGTMTFKKDGEGIKDINYSIFEIKKEDKLPFTWQKNGSSISIRSDGSAFAKTWIIVEDDKSYQKWEATDGAEEVQTLELTK